MTRQELEKRFVDAYEVAMMAKLVLMVDHGVSNGYIEALQIEAINNVNKRLQEGEQRENNKRR